MASAFGSIVVAAICFLPPLVADEAAPGIEVEARSRITGSSTLAPAGGRVSEVSNQVDLSLPVAGSSEFGLELDVIGEHLDFHFKDFGRFLPGRAAPLTAVEVVTLQPTVIFTPTPRWSFVGSGSIQSAGGGNARLGDSTLLSGSAGAIYQYAANRKIGIGIQVEEQMRAPARIIPFPLVDWRISDRWAILALDGESARLSYRATDTLSIIGRLEFQSQDIRLKTSSSIPAGIVRYEAFPLSAGIEYRPNKHLTINADCGAAIAQKYRFEDERGHLLRAGGAHSPWIGTLDIDYSF
jgi:Domain of unknown function (DUF6268)